MVEVVEEARKHTSVGSSDEADEDDEEAPGGRGVRHGHQHQHNIIQHTVYCPTLHNQNIAISPPPPPRESPVS